MISTTVPQSKKTLTLTTNTAHEGKTWKFIYMKGCLNLHDHRVLINPATQTEGLQCWVAMEN